MGTSKGFPTPSGGQWSALKSDISAVLSGSRDVQPKQILSQLVRASGGLRLPLKGLSQVAPPAQSSFGARGGRGGGSAQGGGLSGTSAGLARFASVVSNSGLQDALRTFGLEYLEGRSATEIIGTISDHLAREITGTQGEVVSDALRNAIFEAAASQGDDEFENLEASLQEFVVSEGVQGLVELFLANYTFEQLWHLIETHVDLKSQTEDSRNGLALAIENLCRSSVHDLIVEYQENGDFERVDWFSDQGLSLCDRVISDLEERLRTL